jgi:hypothetical protein
MASAVAFLQWCNYEGSTGGPCFFGREPLTYNSRQERLHNLQLGDCLWLVSRCPEDQQHYFVGVLQVVEKRRNPSQSEIGRTFGEFAVVADSRRSRDFGRTFPAEGLLRAFSFENGKSVKTGAYLGQALQAIRFLSAQDEQVIAHLTPDRGASHAPKLDRPFGLWTKCDGVFAHYFLANWEARHEPLAFLLYDSPPVLSAGAPVFIHSDKNLRIVSSFLEGKYVAGYKMSAEPSERAAERERIWRAYRASTINPPDKSAFDAFWDRQHGVRALFLMENLVEVPEPLPFRAYGRALEWGYPMGVGYRYLSLSQTYLLMQACKLPQSPVSPSLRLVTEDGMRG